MTWLDDAEGWMRILPAMRSCGWLSMRYLSQLSTKERKTMLCYGHGESLSELECEGELMYLIDELCIMD